MDHLKYQKYRKKQLENNFKPINTDKLEKKQKNKEENIYKRHLTLLVRFVN